VNDQTRALIQAMEQYDAILGHIAELQKDMIMWQDRINELRDTGMIDEYAVKRAMDCQ
jgi:hypothetical protein